jgi:hypothetical protein
MAELRKQSEKQDTRLWVLISVLLNKEW